MEGRGKDTKVGYLIVVPRVRRGHRWEGLGWDGRTSWDGACRIFVTSGAEVAGVGL